MKITTTHEKREVLLNTLANHLCTVTFEKLDGSERTMKCTRNLGYMPADFRPKGDKSLKENQDTVAAYDIDAKGWRSFTVDNVTHFNIL